MSTILNGPIKSLRAESSNSTGSDFSTSNDVRARERELSSLVAQQRAQVSN